MTSIYQSLSKAEKIKIFQKCQQLLVQYHPDSEFIVRRSLLNGKRTKTIETLIKLYKDFNGSVYLDDNSVIFFKMFNLTDAQELYKKYELPSEDNADTVFIIFATFNSKMTNIKAIIDTELRGEVKKIAFSREGKFRIHPLAALKAKF